MQPSRTIRVAINGLGRIGRQIVRFLTAAGNEDLELVAVNTLGRIELSAHLLKYDSLYGKLPSSVEVAERRMVINGGSVDYFEREDPAALPWKDLGIDIVIECAGLGEKSRGHLGAGAGMVVVAGSARQPDITICMGVNHDRFEPGKHRFICGASCTANMVAPAINVLNETFGVEQTMVTFIHSYTGEQNLLDSHASEPRRARSATRNIIPTATSGIGHLVAVFPWLAGRIDGCALRVPTPLVHMADLVLKVSRRDDKERLLQVLDEAARGVMKNILAVNYDPLVSSDFRGRRHSCIVDADFSEMIENTIKLVIWHDNESSYCCRIVDLVKYLGAENKSSPGMA